MLPRDIFKSSSRRTSVFNAASNVYLNKYLQNVNEKKHPPTILQLTGGGGGNKLMTILRKTLYCIEPPLPSMRLTSEQEVVVGAGKICVIFSKYEWMKMSRTASAAVRQL